MQLGVVTGYKALAEQEMIGESQARRGCVAAAGADVSYRPAPRPAMVVDTSVGRCAPRHGPEGRERSEGRMLAGQKQTENLSV